MHAIFLNFLVEILKRLNGTKQLSFGYGYKTTLKRKNLAQLTMPLEESHLYFTRPK